MPEYIIAAQCTYSSTANRDAARSAAESTLAGFSWAPHTGRWTGGFNNPNSTSFTISVTVPSETDARTIASDLLPVLNSSGRKYTNASISVYRSNV